VLVEALRPELIPEAETLARLCGLTVDLAGESQRAWSRVWLLRASGDAPVIGLLVAWLVADEAQLLDVGVHPDWRRRGAGRLLMNELLADARRAGARLVLLEVRRSNHAAIALYHRLGFEETRVRPGYYSHPDEDGLEMMLQLADPAEGAARTGSLEE